MDDPPSASGSFVLLSSSRWHVSNSRAKKTDRLSRIRRALPRFHLFNIGGHILPRDADRRAKNGDWVRAEYDTKVSLISRPVLFLRARNKHDSYEIFDR